MTEEILSWAMLIATGVFAALTYRGYGRIERIVEMLRVILKCMREQRSDAVLLPLNVPWLLPRHRVRSLYKQGSERLQWEVWLAGAWAALSVFCFVLLLCLVTGPLFRSTV